MKAPAFEEPATGQDTTDQDGFTNQLADNCVEYALFVIDSRLDSRKQLAQLETIRKSALRFCESLTKSYIWQKDEFNLELRNEQGEQLQPQPRSEPSN